MPNFNYLKNNESDFPHLDNVNTYKYDNDFDYGRFDYTQMELMLCTVPWDMGEAHIGNRTISGIGNVVYFGSKENRDAWFDSIPDSQCYRFETKFKELHRDRIIDVPVPYDMCAKHNYLVVRYAKFANENSPVQYEGEDGLREWFWFVREVEFVAPNTTRLHLLDDAFQTWIYDVNISGMILERGHAPMFETRAGKYLENPLENSEMLLTEDVTFGDANIVKHIDAVSFNDGENVYACIATTANPNGSWGTKQAGSWNVPAVSLSADSGVPSVCVFAVGAANLSTFMTNIDSSIPQFKQTVKGIFFATETMLTLGTSFTFASVACYPVTATRKTIEFVDLEKSQFGYSEKYADIAKLYTYPYAHIEIVDENGDVEIVRVEDTDGTIDISAAMSLAWPFVSIDANLIGVAGSASKTVSFKNINSNSLTVGGKWYETLRSWDVPTFAVVQEASDENDYATHFDRLQRKNDYETALANANASANTAKSNADASADTAKANADDAADMAKDNADDSANTAKANIDDSADAVKSNTDDSADMVKANADDLADTSIANATATNTSNSAQTSYSNLHMTEEARITVYVNTNKTGSGSGGTGLNGLIQNAATSQIAANQEQAAIGIAGGIANGVSNVTAAAAISSGPVGVGLAAGGAIVGAASSYAQSEIANGLTQVNANIQTVGNDITMMYANYATNNNLANNQALNNNLTAERNNLNTTVSANSAATQKSNATRTQTVTKSNATLTNTTTKDNATRDQATTKGNATRTQTTVKGNATREQATAKSNATATQTTTKANATRTADNSQSAIDNSIKQAALRTPEVYGEFANGETATTRPMALYAHIVTQRKAAIAGAGDEMLRYGYHLNRFWEFDGNWNIGKYFTYWKLRDFWVDNLNVPDMYMDKIRFFLFGGVTIWRAPEYIGRKDIYDNFNEG